MSNGLKLLLLSAGTFITCIVVSISIQMARVGKQTGNQMVNHLEDIGKEVQEQNVRKYDGLEVYGADVVNCMKELLGRYEAGEESALAIQVITSKSPHRSYSYSNNEYLDEISNFTKSRYIQPLHKFVGEVVCNENDVIVKLIFTVK